MSHRLHSSKLEYLGLVAASRGFCTELTDRQKVTVDFQTDGVPRDLPHDVSLTLFRVLQESLSNAMKHSGSSHFEVRLRGGSGEVHLVVRDNGVGFDGDAAMNTQGLGLISMRERVALVKGTISIASQPQRGTDVHVCIPVRKADGSQKAHMRTA
jgi:signal transduction histidine kinase